jgi:hypothetical protein
MLIPSSRVYLDGPMPILERYLRTAALPTKSDAAAYPRLAVRNVPRDERSAKADHHRAIRDFPGNPPTRRREKCAMGGFGGGGLSDENWQTKRRL